VSNLLRRLAADIERSREALVPPAYQFLWEIMRFIVLYGGRSAAKSWSIARVLLVLAHEQPLRVLCAREIQGSIRESAYRLLADQISILQLDDFFEIQSDCIIGRNGSRFFFEGLRYNSNKIRSYEGVEIVWVEEAQSVSELSWEVLLPTIRKPGSRFFISFNPLTREDPVARRFVENPPPRTIAKKVSYRDNPFLSQEAEAERAWLERTDPDAYRHVWEGEPRTVSDALILKGKYAVEEFEVSPAWAGPYHGLDYGFARDPSAAVRCYIDDATRELFVAREFWQIGVDIDLLPDALEAAIPGISRHVVYADNARPESTSYLSRNGIALARSAEKWPGSIVDGVSYLRSFARIVIDPSCKHLIDEAGSYSFKTDRLTGTPLPEIEDRHNHCIDSLRYALSPLIRNLPAGGYFNRTAFLVKGEPVGPSSTERGWSIMATAAVCERAGTAVGLIYWHCSPHYGFPLTILDFDLVEIDEALGDAWLARVYARLQALREEWRAADTMSRLYVEEGELHAALLEPATRLLEYDQFPTRDFWQFDSDDLPPPPERVSGIRAAANGGQYVKLARSAYAQQVTHRSVTANHLLNQLLGYRPDVRDASTELVNAFALGCLICRNG
jgi:phage terminase large subunit